MSKCHRDKGRRGESAARNLLIRRGWHVLSCCAGVHQEDFIATDPFGDKWSIEVKNCASILPKHKRQAVRQSIERCLPWVLMNKIENTNCWLVRREGYNPEIWCING